MSLLVCDDHRIFLDALVEALEASGHDDVLTASGPAEALRVVDRFSPDLVVLDVQMPGVSGIELARQLRNRCPRPAIVLLTGSTDASVRQAYDDGLVDAAVSKACSIRTLDAVIRRVQAGQRTMVGWKVECCPPCRTALDLLTAREQEVLALISEGVSTEVMAQRMVVSVNTVRTHVRSVMHKLGVHQRIKASRAAYDLGLVTAT